MHRARSLLAPGILALCLVCCAVWGADEAKNLIHNGSFEALKEGKAADWTMPEGAAIVEEAGKHFLRVTVEGENKSVAATQKVKLEPAWNKLTLTARLRGKNIKTGEQAWNEPRITLFFMDDAGEHVGDWPEAIRLREDSADWKESSVTVEVPSGAKAVEVRVGLISAQGQVDFDDIRLEAK